MDHYYKQPNYYKNFHCLGGDCILSCCREWDINWRKTEYEKLLSDNYSEDLNSNPEKYFKPVTIQGYNIYNVIFSENGFCPFMEEDTGLCSIQKKLGEEHLSLTCRIYPRFFRSRQNTIFRMCSTSCSYVIELLMNNRDAVQLETLVSHDYKKISEFALQFDTVKDVAESPYLKYRMNILDFYADLFNLNADLEDIIVLGALAAKKISDFTSNGKVDAIPDIIKSLKKQFVTPSTIDSVRDIKSNYSIKYTVVNNCLVQFLPKDSDIIKSVSLLHNGENLVPEKFNQGKDNLFKFLGNREYAMKNIAANLFYDIFMHLNFTQRSFFDFYSFFTVCIAAVQVISYSIGYSSENIEHDILLYLSDFGRSITHNKDRANRITDYIKEIGLVSPAHLALIIK